MLDFLNISRNVPKSERKKTISPLEIKAFQKNIDIFDHIDGILRRKIIPGSNVMISTTEATYYYDKKCVNTMWNSGKRIIIINFFSPKKGYAEPYLSMVFELHETLGEFRIFMFGSIVNGRPMLEFFEIHRNIENNTYSPVYLLP